MDHSHSESGNSTCHHAHTHTHAHAHAHAHTHTHTHTQEQNIKSQVDKNSFSDLSRKVVEPMQKVYENEARLISELVCLNCLSFGVSFFAFIYVTDPLILSRVLSRAVTSLEVTHYDANYDATS